jgi:ABC-type Fe3+/spermidine/putrescine transport system ATPase subunit
MLLQGCALGNRAAPFHLQLARGETLALLGAGASETLRALPEQAKGLMTRLVDGADRLLADRSVAQNLALGLREGQADAAALVARWLHVLGLSAVSGLPPVSLGVEAQRRIALGRALVGAPDLLLLDDPFCGCDPEERRRLAEALRLLQLHNRMGMVITTRYPPDARAMADRVMVLRDGLLLQQGPSVHVYERPACAYAARALGEVNQLPGHLDEIIDDVALVTLDVGVQVEAMVADAEPGCDCWIAVRPERIAVVAATAEEMGQGSMELGALAARVDNAVHHGDHIRLGLSVGTTRLVIRRPPGPLLTLGAEVAIAWQTQHAHAVRRDGTTT